MVAGMQGREARTDVGEPYSSWTTVVPRACGKCGGSVVHPPSRVLDRQPEAARLHEPGLHAQHERGIGRAGGAVLYRVLDERIEEERGYLATQRCGIDVHARVESLLESHLLDREVPA